MNRTVEIEIGDLVIHGIQLEDRGAVAEALRMELARLISERGLPAWLEREGAVPGFVADMADAPAGDGPEAAGVRAARSIYGGLDR